jgi:hypothetical protein
MASIKYIEGWAWNPAGQRGRNPAALMRLCGNRLNRRLPIMGELSEHTGEGRHPILKKLEDGNK